MFEEKWEPCDVELPHKNHYRRRWWQICERYCPGVSLDPWLKANPKWGTLILPHDLKPPEKELHKHRLWLTARSTKYRRPLTHHETILKFSCRDGCKYPTGEYWSVSIPRWKYNDMVLNRTGINQTWPQ